MRRLSKRAVLSSTCFGILIAATAVQAQTTNPSNTSSAAAPADNTQTNQRDRTGQTTTPMSQPNDSADIKLAAAVRRAVVKDKSLSLSAHNAKIVVVQGAVTLRGPVKSDDEKAQVESLVKGVAGVTRVDNELDVEH